MMTYQQWIAWPTRRKHLFEPHEEVSICGGVIEGQCDMVVRAVREIDITAYHHIDDLNYCQSCLRVAMSRAGQEYKPLTERYEKLAAKYAKLKKKG